MRLRSEYEERNVSGYGSVWSRVGLEVPTVDNKHGWGRNDGIVRALGVVESNKRLLKSVSKSNCDNGECMHLKLVLE